MNSDLFEHLKRFSTNPYLFVGSGLSRRYLGLPTWEELLLNFFKTSEIPGEFEYYKSSCDGDLPKLASILASHFHETWWKNPKYDESRNRNRVMAGFYKAAPFKIELSDYISKNVKVEKKYLKEIDYLRKSVVDGVITTNWDLQLDSLFDEYKVYVGQQELIFSESISIGEIYKIHGSISSPLSLILTKEDYENFNQRNAYLAAKLLTLIIEHPVLFLGYSLSDDNILSIINSIVECVEHKNLEKLKDRLIFVEWKIGNEFEIKDSVMKLPGGKVLPIKLITTDSFEPIFETLSCLERQIPVKILRRLKNSVIELVKSNTPQKRVYVHDIEAIDDSTEIEYAIGIGMATKLSSQGYTAIETIDIIEDIIFENRDFEATQILQDVLPRIRKGRNNVPVYKYLRQEKCLNKNATLNAIGAARIKGVFDMKKDIPKCLFPAHQYSKKQNEIRRNHKDVNSIVATFDMSHCLEMIPLLETKSIDLAQLLKFLKKCFKSEAVKTTSSFRKLVCYYDYLKYGLEN